MTREYTPDELLPLSGLQHFVFCRRQWALIHIEQQWAENARTAEGRHVHQRADDPFFTEARRGVIVARSVPIASYRLGLAGVCDVVEFTEAAEGVRLPGRVGLYQPAPVEYKRGKPKTDPCDEAQLCGQAMCLEEMLAATIGAGYLYYGQTRHRVPVALTAERRELVRRSAEEMHAYFARGFTPRVRPQRGCRACSLADMCLPGLRKGAGSVAAYIRGRLEVE